jgi:hypothetical protein
MAVGTALECWRGIGSSLFNYSDNVAAGFSLRWLGRAGGTPLSGGPPGCPYMVGREVIFLQGPQLLQPNRGLIFHLE